MKSQIFKKLTPLLLAGFLLLGASCSKENIKMEGGQGSAPAQQSQGQGKAAKGAGKAGIADDSRFSSNAVSNKIETVTKDGKLFTKDGRPVYKAVFGPPFPPFSLRDDQGHIIGFTKEILDYIKNDQKIEIIYESRPWNGIFKYVANGEFDILAGSVAINPTNVQEWDFTHPYFKSHIMALSVERYDINSFDDINAQDLSIAVQKRSNADIIVSRRISNPDHIRYKDTVFLGVKDVIKEIDNVVVSDSGPLMYFAKQYKQFSPVTYELPEFGDHYFGLVIKKGRNDLLEKLDAGINNMMKSGEYNKIYDKWFHRVPDELPSVKEVVAGFQKKEAAK